MERLLSRENLGICYFPGLIVQSAGEDDSAKHSEGHREGERVVRAALERDRGEREIRHR